MVVVAPKDYIAAVSRLPTEVIYWTDSRTLGKYESFNHPNMLI